MSKKIKIILIALGIVSITTTTIILGGIDPYRLDIAKATDTEIEKIIVDSAIAGDKPTFVIRVDTNDKDRIELAYKRIREGLKIKTDNKDRNIYNHIREAKLKEGIVIKPSKNSVYEAKTLQEFQTSVSAVQDISLIDN